MTSSAPRQAASRRALQPFALSERAHEAFRRLLRSRHHLAEPALQRHFDRLILKGGQGGQAVDVREPCLALAQEREHTVTLAQLAAEGVLLQETASLGWGLRRRDGIPAPERGHPAPAVGPQHAGLKR